MLTSRYSLRDFKKASSDFSGNVPKLLGTIMSIAETYSNQLNICMNQLSRQKWNTIHNFWKYGIDHFYSTSNLCAKECVYGLPIILFGLLVVGEFLPYNQFALSKTDQNIDM